MCLFNKKILNSQPCSIEGRCYDNNVRQSKGVEDDYWNK